MRQGYLKDPSVSFCAINGSEEHENTIQVTDFGQGAHLHELVSKIYLGKGVPSFGCDFKHQPYEHSAFFYLQQCELENVELPYFFITGNKSFYKILKKMMVKTYMGNVSPYEPKDGPRKEKELSFLSKMKKMFVGSSPALKSDKENILSVEIFEELKKKFNVFHLHLSYNEKKIEKIKLDDWREALGEECVFELQTPNAMIDVILGVIALTSGSRTMEEYSKDMEKRGQSIERIKEVQYSLRHLTPKFLEKNVLKYQKAEKEEDIGNTGKENKSKEEKKEEN